MEPHPAVWSRPSDEHFQSVECEILIGNIQPEEIVVGEGARGVWRHMRKFNFCISEERAKDWCKKPRANKQHLKNGATSLQGNRS